MHKYIQPKVSKSFKPIQLSSRRHGASVEKITTYQLSYRNGPIQTASSLNPAVLPQDSLTVGDGAMTDETIYKMSYVGNWCIKPDTSYSKNSPWRTAKHWMSRGPMQNSTTQKEDFTWRCIPTSKPHKKSNNLYSSYASLSDDTTYKLSYYASNNCIPVKSFKPKTSTHARATSNVPIEGCTTYKLSYWPNKIQLKEKYPWKPKINYHRPSTALNDDTTYRLSYWPNKNPQVRKPFTSKASTENILNTEYPFYDKTTYNLSYYGCSDGSEKRTPIKRAVNPTEFSSCPLSHDTIHRMSYLGNWSLPHEEVKIYSPLRTTNQWLGRGPLEGMTTHKYDYTWKRNISDRIHARPSDNLGFSSSPLENCTTHKLSYWPNVHDLVRDKPFKPIIGQINNPCDIPMENETTMRLSYQPVQTVMPQSKLSKKRSGYRQLRTPIDDDTTYNLSYTPPGTLEPINCDQSCPTISDVTPQVILEDSCRDPASQAAMNRTTYCASCNRI